MALDDYGSIIQSGMNLIPDVNQQILQRAQASLMNTQTQAAQQQLALQKLEYQRQLTFGKDMSAFIQNPSASGLAALFGKYPEYAKQASDAWGAMDADRRLKDTTQLGEATTLALRGDYQGAAKVVQGRIDAEKAAGRDTSQYQPVLDLLNSGDPAKQRAVQGVLSYLIGTAVGPDKAAEFLKANGLSQEPITVGMDQRLVNQQGQTIVGGQPKLQPVTDPITGKSAPFNPYTGKFGAAAVDGSDTAAPSQAGGGGPASAGGDGGFDHAVSTVLSNEGGYAPKDMNGAPVNMGINLKANPPKVLAKYGITDFKSMTPDQAKQLYYDRYWKPSGAEDLPANLQTPYFDVYVRNPKFAKTALAQSGGDPARFMQLASAYFQRLGQTKAGQKYAAAWANRDAANAAMATGAVAAGAPAGNVASAPQSDPYSFGGEGLNTKGAEQGFAWNATHTKEIPIPGGTQDLNSYNPQEIDDLARNWIATGPTAFASLGGSMGGGGIAQLKKAALARATQMMAQAGITADQLPAIRSKYTGLNKAMTENTQIVNALSSAQDGLQRDAALVKQTQKALVDNHIINDDPAIVNNGRIAFYEQFGSAQTRQQIRAYKDAVNAFAQTYGKFMSAANGVGGSAAPSDAARGLARELNDEGMGPKTLEGHLNTVLAEASNKTAGFRHQGAMIQNQLSNLIGGPKAQSDLPAGAKVIGTYHGRRVIEVNGQRMVEQ